MRHYILSINHSTYYKITNTKTNNKKETFGSGTILVTRGSIGRSVKEYCQSGNIRYEYDHHSFVLIYKKSSRVLINRTCINYHHY